MGLGDLIEEMLRSSLIVAKKLNSPKYIRRNEHRTYLSELKEELNRREKVYQPLE